MPLLGFPHLIAPRHWLQALFLKNYEYSPGVNGNPLSLNESAPAVKSRLRCSRKVMNIDAKSYPSEQNCQSDCISCMRQISHRRSTRKRHKNVRCRMKSEFYTRGEGQKKVGVILGAQNMGEPEAQRNHSASGNVWGKDPKGRRCPRTYARKSAEGVAAMEWYCLGDISCRNMMMLLMLIATGTCLQPGEGARVWVWGLQVEVKESWRWQKRDRRSHRGKP